MHDLLVCFRLAAAIQAKEIDLCTLKGTRSFDWPFFYALFPSMPLFFHSASLGGIWFHVSTVPAGTAKTIFML